MTPEEKTAQMAIRNDAICTYYLDGHKVAECARHFQLNRQRILQILKQAGVWVPYVKTRRTQFLGVSVKVSTKVALMRKADQEGTSVSRLVSDAADQLVKK